MRFAKKFLGRFILNLFWIFLVGVVILFLFSLVGIVFFLIDHYNLQFHALILSSLIYIGKWTWDVVYQDYKDTIKEVEGEK